MINYTLLESQSDIFAKRFKEARPFPHLVVDNFLDASVAAEAHKSFPRIEDMDTLNDHRQRKAQDPAIDKFHPLFSEIIFEHLHSHRLLTWLERVTGINNLKADARLYASGLAQGANGSFLNVHLDNSSHPAKPWFRRVNLIIYLNAHWNEEKGGQLEFWAEDMKSSTSILPVLNRMALFATDKRSWHGYRPVNTPDGDTRKSINIYYFTEESPDGTDYYHVTTFRARNNETANKVIYPIDNLVRTVARKLRAEKDSHAVLFDSDGEKKSDE
ncbi:MAG: 2OG-Fe(II) oxygenase [Acidobacteria bacterium]|nr:2OG-Fe(II) oxygenase [Acidobacteriota bacterium]